MISITSISGNFFKVSSDEQYYYIVGDTGLVIISKDTTQEIAYATLSGGFSDVWTNEGESVVYLTTSGSGLYKINKVLDWEGDISGSLALHLATPDINTNILLSIDGLSKDNFVIGTISGVEYIEGNTIVSGAGFYPVTSVKLLEEGVIYYAGAFGLVKKDSPTQQDWNEENILFLLDTNTLPYLTSLPVTDLDVIKTEDEITIAVSSTSGVTLIKEVSHHLVRSSSFFHLFKE